MRPRKLTEGTVLSSSCWLTLRVESMKKTRDSLVVPSRLWLTWSAGREEEEEEEGQRQEGEGVRETFPHYKLSHQKSQTKQQFSLTTVYYTYPNIPHLQSKIWGQLTQNKGDVFASEEAGHELGGGVQDAGEPKEVRLAHQVLQLSDCDRGEVDDGEWGVVSLWPHDVTGEGVVGELPLAVQERIAIEMDVPVVAGGRWRGSRNTPQEN